MTLSDIIKEMQGRQPALIVAAHTSTELALAHVCLAIGELEQRIAALETAQSRVFTGQYENTPAMEGPRNDPERRKPGRPRKDSISL